MEAVQRLHNKGCQHQQNVRAQCLQSVSRQLLIAVSIKMKILRPDSHAQKKTHMLLIQMLRKKKQKKNNKVEEVTA